MELGNLLTDVKEKPRVVHATRANTDAVSRDGAARNSDEAVVMAVERRGRGVLEMKSINVRKERRNW